MCVCVCVCVCYILLNILSIDFYKQLCVDVSLPLIIKAFNSTFDIRNTAYAHSYAIYLNLGSYRTIAVIANENPTMT